MLAELPPNRFRAAQFERPPSLVFNTIYQRFCADTANTLSWSNSLLAVVVSIRSTPFDRARTGLVPHQITFV
jgi:hypothetical protein